MSSVIRKFGTAPVFFTAISTILGAIMFLRFGFAVGTLGILGTFAIILIGHAVTIPTAMAIAEIATNQRVEGGGEYFIISRSFGLVIGSTIGIALYLSQAISVAFYIMAFSEAFVPLFSWIAREFTLPGWLTWLLEQPQTVGVPALIVLTGIMLTRGADLGVKMLYLVVATLGISLLAFFAGQTGYTPDDPTGLMQLIQSSEETIKADTADFPLNASPNVPVAEQGSPDTKAPILPDIGFFTVFAIIFPAFTGMTAGVGLSGDLRDPGRSIPLGTLAATVIGMVIYLFITIKLAWSAPPEMLADTSRLVMSDIAWQGWLLIPIGLAAATLSSALGSIMVAPRTLQAIAKDGIFPGRGLNQWLQDGKGDGDEPFNASVLTVLLGLGFIMLGAIDTVAAVISMFFMVTYGSLCLISFLQHFAADPAYRPRFRSRWWISLFGAVACFGLMFFMDAGIALLAVVLMIILYQVLSRVNPDKKSLAVIFQGVTFQLSRQMQVFLQKADKENSDSWRPSAICLSEHSFERLGGFDLLRWISQRYGFGTYIHLINGYLSRKTAEQAGLCKDRLIALAEQSDSQVYIDTMVSPSYTSSIAQVIQLPGIAGTENNLIIFEFSKMRPEELSHLIDNFKLINSVRFDTLLLASSERGFGMKKELHVWLTSTDKSNANLMILLAYIIAGHHEWEGAEIKIFALYPKDMVDQEREGLHTLIQTGQLPISEHNIMFITQEPDQPKRAIIQENSRDAGLVMLGFVFEAVRQKGPEVFTGYDELGNILFVNAVGEKRIK